MFYRQHALAYSKPQFRELCQPVTVTSTAIFESVVENQLGVVETPHPENQNRAPLLRKKHEIQLPWPSKLGRCQQGPLAISLMSEFPSPR